MTRVAVFIDYQNVYHGAREAFGLVDDDFTAGQIYPQRTGLLLTQRGRAIDAQRELSSVFVFRGEPVARYNPLGQAAFQRQRRHWAAQRTVVPVSRPLKYSHAGVDWNGQPRFEAREKGIDVLIALTMVGGAVRDEYDVAVLFSADSDLVPAVQEVIAAGKRCEVRPGRAVRGSGHGFPFLRRPEFGVTGSTSVPRRWSAPRPTTPVRFRANRPRSRVLRATALFAAELV